MNDPNKTEHDLLNEGQAPLINQMGIDAAAQSPNIREALKLQLKSVHEQIEHYLPTKARGWGDDDKMPHEWGSLDTYDDMRNSVRALSVLLEGVLDGNDKETVLDAACEGGACAIAFGDIVMRLGEFKDEDDMWDKLGEREVR